MAFAMLFFTIITLCNSVSNSGQLNITSFLIMFVIDQIGVRIGVGLIMVGIVAGLEKMEILVYCDNLFVNCLCEEELTSLRI